MDWRRQRHRVSRLEFYSILLRCRRSFNVSIGLDEASCPEVQVVLARDKLRAECALSAVPVPGIEVTVQKITTKLIGHVGRSDFFLCLFPWFAGKLGLNKVTGDRVHSSRDSKKNYGTRFCPKYGFVSLGSDFTTALSHAAADHSVYYWVG